MTSEDKITLITIQGATAVGKSKLVLELAERFKSPIISADSRQVYKYLDIATAKPSREERKIIPHYLIDLVEPSEEYNAGTFVKDAKKVIMKISERGKIPIICGGTGFYIKALTEGIFRAPEIPNEIRDKLRSIAVESGPSFLYDKLTVVDKESAVRINKNDTNRILRALEIYNTTGKTISQLWEQDDTNNIDYNIYKILMIEDRKSLYAKINDRVEKMFDQGLLTEMENLLNMGYKESDPGMNTVGYKELFSYFNGQTKLDDCKEEIKKNTRNFAKRQLTWYRKIDFDLTLDTKKINFLDVHQSIVKFCREKK
ncbi:MAG: tRNA (adenosine(37)-N6)-dimethylallyltransferase MiaA [Candidatus Cloacimonetes bacterium]|nr:tRNA (adenosine(37)-N6)-dimethylallyltransferase MiaA [Candidatus Cloacimonadota bacterium]